MSHLNPFTEGSVVAKVFDMAVKGTTRDAINKVAEKEKAGAPRLFHCLRLEAYGEVTWNFNQSEDEKIKLTNVGKAKAVARKPAAKAVAAKSPMQRKKAA